MSKLKTSKVNHISYTLEIGDRLISKTSREVYTIDKISKSSDPNYNCIYVYSNTLYGTISGFSVKEHFDLEPECRKRKEFKANFEEILNG